MGDNLIVDLNIEAIKQLIASNKIAPSKYCVISSNKNNNNDPIVITTDRNLKRILLKDYHATEISDWAFNKEYQKIKNHAEYLIIGEGSLIDKGY